MTSLSMIHSVDIMKGELSLIMPKNKKTFTFSLILAIAAVGQVVIAIIFYDPDGNVNIINLGWGILMVSAVFGWLPIFTFRRRGQVNGKGYIHTTQLVDSGVYGIVRHPQYLSGVLICVALPLISQHWLVPVPGVVAAVQYYLLALAEEKHNIDKFGDSYKNYMQRVPRMNFILGIIRAIFRAYRKKKAGM